MPLFSYNFLKQLNKSALDQKLMRLCSMKPKFIIGLLAKGNQLLGRDYPSRCYTKIIMRRNRPMV